MATENINVKRIAGVDETDIESQLIPRQIGMENTDNQLAAKFPSGDTKFYTPKEGDASFNSMTITGLPLAGNVKANIDGTLYIGEATENVISNYDQFKAALEATPPGLVPVSYFVANTIAIPNNETITCVASNRIFLGSTIEFGNNVTLSGGGVLQFQSSVTFTGTLSLINTSILVRKVTNHVTFGGNGNVTYEELTSAGSITLIDTAEADQDYWNDTTTNIIYNYAEFKDAVENVPAGGSAPISYFIANTIYVPQDETLNLGVGYTNIYFHGAPVDFGHNVTLNGGLLLMFHCDTYFRSIDPSGGLLTINDGAGVNVRILAEDLTVAGTGGGFTYEKLQSWDIATEATGAATIGQQYWDNTILGADNWIYENVSADVNPAVKNHAYRVDAGAGIIEVKLPDVVTGNRDVFKVYMADDSHHVKVTTVGGTQLFCNGLTFIGIATVSGCMVFKANGVDGYEKVLDTTVYYRKSTITSSTDLSAGYESGGVYLLQPPADTEIVVAIPDPAIQHIGFYAKFILATSNGGSVRLTTPSGIATIGDSTEPTIVIPYKGFEVMDDGVSYHVTQDSRPSVASSAITFYALDEASVIVPYARAAISTTDPDYDAVTSVGVTALATPQGGFISNEGILAGLVTETNISSSAKFRRISGSGTATFYTEVYRRETGGTEHLLTTLNETVAISSASYVEVFSTGILPETNFLSTDSVIIKLYANRVSGGSNPTFEIEAEGTTPARLTFNIPSATQTHDSLSAKGTAGTGVTFGHVDNSKPLQTPELSTAERNAVTSPVAGMVIRNTTTSQLEEYDGSSWNILGGLVPVDEGNGIGFHLKGDNRANKGDIGSNAVDLSYSSGVSTTRGATGEHSHAEGTSTIASGTASHAEGDATTAAGLDSHAEGVGTNALGDNSHAEGVNTTASGHTAHAEGWSTTALGIISHAEGNGTTASGYTAHAEGDGTVASGERSHAQNNNTKAVADNSTAMGLYNTGDADSLLEIGMGTSDIARANAFKVGADGNVEIPNGNLGVGTDSPSSLLHVKASKSGSDGGIRVTGYTYPSDVSYWSENQFAMKYNGVYKNAISSIGDSFFNGGNVGIGTDSPSSTLHLKGGRTITGTGDNWGYEILTLEDDTEEYPAMTFKGVSGYQNAIRSNPLGGVDIYSLETDGTIANGMMHLTADGLVTAPEMDVADIAGAASGKVLITRDYAENSGVTGSRPSAPNTGQFYFDTTITKPIWYSGSNWVDATGTTV